MIRLAIVGGCLIDRHDAAQVGLNGVPLIESQPASFGKLNASLGYLLKVASSESNQETDIPVPL